MKRLIPLFALCASPAMAHSGAHLHPHGIDAATLILATSFGAAVTYAVVKVRK